MSIGGSIFLLVAGLILALAVEVEPTTTGSINIEWGVVGWILVGAGLLGLALSLYVHQRRTSVYREPLAPPTAERTTIIEDDRHSPLP